MFDAAPPTLPDRILRPQEAARYLGVSLQQVYQIEKKIPAFPRRRVVSEGVSGWLISDLRAYLDRNDASVPVRKRKPAPSNEAEAL